MSYLELKEENLIAKGGERDCYAHPKDNTKVVKTLHTQGIHNNQNELEYMYMSYLKRKSINLSHVTDCYGYIDTNFGKGLIFDRVLDYDNKPTKSFRFMVANKIILMDIQKELIEELKNYLETNLVLFVDTSLTNIFCQEIDENRYKLIIVDGLGSKRLGLKFWLYRNSKVYTKYKIRRQWEKFMTMYDKDIKRVKLGKRPFTRL